MDIRLSKSQLDKFQACARCFWLKQRRKLDQPDMISSKVWKGIERVTQVHYEVYRQRQETPPNLVGQVPAGAIPYQGDRIDLAALRYWGKGMPFKVDGITVTTALDEMLEWETAAAGEKKYAVLDYKSKSKPTDEESTRDLYQNQADVYDLACNLNGYPTDGVVYFDYWSPASVEGSESGSTTQKWVSQVIALKADHERIKGIIRAAAACLEGPLPDPQVKKVTGKRGGVKIEGCVVCAYVLEYGENMEAMLAEAGRSGDVR